MGVSDVVALQGGEAPLLKRDISAAGAAYRIAVGPSQSDGMSENWCGGQDSNLHSLAAGRLQRLGLIGARCLHM